MIREDVVIRQAKIEDASGILHIQEEVVLEGKFLTTVSEEFNKTVEQQRDWVEKVLKNDKETMLVAVYQGTILGWIVFFSSNRVRLSHTGSIGMMVKKDFRSMGVGKLLIKHLLDWAEQHQSIEKVSLGVFLTNQKAIALYKDMGFIEEGRKVKEFKLNEDEYVDDILMCKFV
ncbi:ribosomal protein S18 acetylase RimI-like enzyme [Alkalibacillus salilacus]|uniref:Ribosomal protein S18 acetylase RimI-like enzyme n=1 Tax=Alkalibacillus salilacus TaxID=284582 RepID=A0ABT9VII7_9BACI|nr:ribosomal protein S18 acetylase RimI-like enzyme [Alkalibacillus salilacus]